MIWEQLCSHYPFTNTRVISHDSECLIIRVNFQDDDPKCLVIETCGFSSQD